MDRFLLQVSNNIGYSEIMNSGQYSNHRWMQKNRDSYHGEVNSSSADTGI